MSQHPEPPLAAQRPHILETHGKRRNDPWFWLRDDTRSQPEVLDYLRAENAYTQQALEPGMALRECLKAEMISRVIRDDESVPYPMGPFEYFSRVSGDAEYTQYWRRQIRSADQSPLVDQPPDLILDANLRAQDQAFYELGGLSVSDDHRWLAITEDTVGRRLYTLTLIDLNSGHVTSPGIEGISGAIVWSADSRFIFYVRKHPETLLPWQVWRHRLGSSPAEDVKCREESDPAFHTTIYRGTSLQTIYIHHGSTLSDEVWWLAADAPEQAFRLFAPRSRGHEYSVDDRAGRFFVRSNHRHENFEIFEASPDHAANTSQWDCLSPAAADVLIEDLELFDDHLVVAERRNGLPALRVQPLNGDESWAVTLGEEQQAEADGGRACFYLDDNGVDQPQLRFGVTSMTRPYEIYDLNLGTRSLTLRKRSAVGGIFEPALYTSQRLQVIARDGVSVPVSLVYRPDDLPLHQRPVLIYGYGAYGHCVDPGFSATRLSLLDRGVVFAIAHVRGGEDLGRQWYHAGRTDKKPNTFNDFVDVTRGLLEQRVGDPKRVMAMGGSAGGLLMAAVINQAPELYRAVVAQVPFVDVLTTMLDEDIPLTTGEFDEWGNPAVQKDYARIARWSPYDNVEAGEYPALLVTSGLHDSQVQYWEPTKWVAKLRQLKTDDNLLLLHTEMDAGHGGVSGRYRQFEERAMEYTFLLMQVGVSEPL